MIELSYHLYKKQKIPKDCISVMKKECVNVSELPAVSSTFKTTDKQNLDLKK